VDGMTGVRHGMILGRGPWGDNVVAFPGRLAADGNRPSRHEIAGVGRAGAAGTSRRGRGPGSPRLAAVGDGGRPDHSVSVDFLQRVAQ
jgi:hypothetical protein